VADLATDISQPLQLINIGQLLRKFLTDSLLDTSIEAVLQQSGHKISAASFNCIDIYFFEGTLPFRERGIDLLENN